MHRESWRDSGVLDIFFAACGTGYLLTALAEHVEVLSCAGGHALMTPVQGTPWKPMCRALPYAANRECEQRASRDTMRLGPTITNKEHAISNNKYLCSSHARHVKG